MSRVLNFFGKKKTREGNEKTRKRIEAEIEAVTESKEGFYAKTKEIDSINYITIIFDKRATGFNIDASNTKIPDYISFLIIVDSLTYPEKPPKILSKSNFSSPSLMDGRDLLKEICPKWDEKKTLLDISKQIPGFIARVINSKGYKFYGNFDIGAVYDMKNFENMYINSFSCKVGKGYLNDNVDENLFDSSAEHILMLSGDAIVLFEKNSSGNGKVVFWGSLYSITELQINKKQKVVDINFYDDEETNEYHLQLIIDNIVFFRDTLLKKMRSLRIKAETSKIIKGQNNFKRLSTKEVNTMDINKIEEAIKELQGRIEGGEINDYTVKTFTSLCGKAIEHFSEIGDPKHMDYLTIMKKILLLDGVQKLTIEDQEEMEKMSQEENEEKNK